MLYVKCHMGLRVKFFKCPFRCDKHSVANYKDIKATLLIISKERKIYKCLKVEQWIVTSTVYLSNKALRIIFKRN